MSLRLASALTRTRRLHKKRSFPDIQQASTKGLTAWLVDLVLSRRLKKEAKLVPYSDFWLEYSMIFLD